MQFRTANVTVDSTGKATVAASTDNSLSSVAIKGVTGLASPFSADNDNKLVTEREAGIRQWVTGGLAFLGGELMGHKRAAKGSRPILGFMG